MKRSESISPKFLFVGLNGAGKTSLIQAFVYKQDTEDSLDTIPTLGMEANQISYPDGSLLIWELGGQEKFRNLYLRSPEKFFFGVHALIYIVDIQDQIRFNECCLYLIQILETLKSLNSNCHIILLYHKCDPKFIDSTQFINNYEKIDGLLIPELKKRDIKFVRRFTSVYYSHVELNRLLTGLVDINLMSRLLNIEVNEASESHQSNLKTKIKDFFRKFVKSNESVVDISELVPDLDDKIITQIELENIVQIIGSQGVKDFIVTKNYSRASYYIEKMNELWKLKD